MNLKHPIFVGVFLIALALLGVCSVKLYEAHAAAAIPDASACVPHNPDESCPTQIFLNEFALLQHKQDEHAAIMNGSVMQHVIELEADINGLTNILAGMEAPDPVTHMPTVQYDPAKRRLIKIPKKPDDPGTAPAPAPAPKK